MLTKYTTKQMLRMVEDALTIIAYLRAVVQACSFSCSRHLRHRILPLRVSLGQRQQLVPCAPESRDYRRRGKNV